MKISRLIQDTPHPLTESTALELTLEILAAVYAAITPDTPEKLTMQHDLASAARVIHLYKTKYEYGQIEL